MEPGLGKGMKWKKQKLDCNFILGKGEGELQEINDMFYTDTQEMKFTKVYFYPEVKKRFKK